MPIEIGPAGAVVAKILNSSVMLGEGLKSVCFRFSQGEKRRGFAGMAGVQRDSSTVASTQGWQGLTIG
jgi:hypothetical protein